MRGIAFLILIFGTAAAVAATEINTTVPKSKSTCNDSTFDPVVQISVPGHPFGVLPTADGCRVFVSITQADPEKPAGIEIFKRDQGRITHFALAPIENGHPLDMVLTHDEKILIVADQDDVVFFDAKKLDVSNPATVISQPQLGRLKYGENSGSIYVNVTAGDRFVFVADERARTITVVDLKKALKNKFSADSVVGKLATGNSPLALTFSPDQTKLYATSEFGPAGREWPTTCPKNDSDNAASRGGLNPQGAVLVIDVKKAEIDPAHSLLAAVPAGCSPVRLVLSPDGKRAYVSARSDGALLVFDTDKLLTDATHAQIGRVRLNAAPLGLMTINGGNHVVVATLHSLEKSEAFKNQELAVIDTTKIDDTADAKIGTIATGAYPRELRTSIDENTLFLTNFNSNSIEVVDLRRLSDILR